MVRAYHVRAATMSPPSVGWHKWQDVACYSRVCFWTVADLYASHRTVWPRLNMQRVRNRSNGNAWRVVVLDKSEIQLSDKTANTEPGHGGAHMAWCGAV
jgi:hypothetical protein